MKIPGRLLAVVAAMVFTVAPVRAEVWFSWGSEVYSNLRDSYGNRLDASYTFELGAFDPSFTPTAANVVTDAWRANWKVFDVAPVVVTANTNLPTDYFRSEAYMLENGRSTSTNPLVTSQDYDFRGLDAYMWGYNTRTYTQTLEWVWFRAPSWVFPANVDPGPALTPTDWSVSQLVAGNVPLWGRQASDVGLGYASAPGVLGNYDLQTYTLESTQVIPEPSTIFIAVLLAAIAIAHRWKRRRASAVAAVLGLSVVMTLPAQATRINFYSSPGVPAYGSNGQPLNEDTYFEVGVFTNGFVPSATNTSQWSANWVPAQRTKFTTKHNWFTSVFDVTNNAAPFTAGAPAYVWGFSGSEAAGQWLLFRATNWTWPTANDTAPTPLFWSAKDAKVVVVGSLPTASGNAVSLRPTAISNSLPPVTTWRQWKEDKLAGQPLGNPADDADGDGIANIIEFALGTAPNSANDRPASPDGWNRLGRGPDGKEYLEIRVPRRRDRPVDFSAEVSSDLRQGWSSGTTQVDKVEDTVDALTLRDKTPIGEAGNQRFIRIKATVNP